MYIQNKALDITIFREPNCLIRHGHPKNYFDSIFEAYLISIHQAVIFYKVEMFVSLFVHDQFYHVSAFPPKYLYTLKCLGGKARCNCCAIKSKLLHLKIGSYKENFI